MVKLNVLALSWHSIYEGHIAVGGVRRIIELAKRAPGDMHLWILDNSPTVLDFKESQFTVIVYEIPDFVYHLSKRSFLLGRFVEMITASVKLFLEGRRVLKNKGCQVIYAPMAGLLFLFLPAFFLKFFYHRSVVIDIFDFEPPYGSVLNYYRKLRKDGYSFLRSLLLPVYIKFQFFVIKILSRSIDCVLTVSQYQSDFIRRAGGKNPTGFMPGGIDYKFIQSISRGDEGFDAVFVGRHTAEKGIFDLLEIWKRVVTARPGTRLGMIGTCDQATRNILAERIKTYRLTDDITIKGVLSEEDKIKIIKASKVFAHFGQIEPLIPVITVLEGLACGLPAVLYDLPSYREQKEVYGHPAFALVPLGDYQTAAEKVINFIDMDISSRAGIADRAKDFASGYDWDNVADFEFKVIRKFGKQ